MNTQTAWIIAGLAIIGAIALFMFSSDSRTYGNASTIDKLFIEQMIPHHEGAIGMAKVALQKSKRPEVLSLAKAITEAQTKEITDMRAWYRDWFSAEVPVSHVGHGPEMMGDLTKLNAAPDFDMEFLSQMIVHHEMAVMMGRTLAEGTERDEMKALANNIVTSQTQEIEMMRSWIKAWYDTSN